MEDIIYIKYGELSLKGKNKKNFINKLYENIKIALKGFDYKLKKNFDNSEISNFGKNSREILEILKLIPGIQYVILAFKIERNLDLLFNEIANRIDQSKTFKLNVKRKDKTFPIDSREVTIIVANKLISHFNNELKVNVINPEQEVMIEIKKEFIITYFEKHNGANGFPVGINGEALVLLSGGIDSPVAASLIQKKGLTPNFISFITSEVAVDETIRKIEKLVKKINLDGKLSNGKLFFVDFNKIMREIKHAFDDSYNIIIMRRMFFRISEGIAKKINCSVLVTGDSIGQVASQTIESMNLTSEILNDIMVFRPLLCLDKMEIVELAKKFGTFEISILKHNDLCEMFFPKKPTTKPKIKKLNEIEEKIDLLYHLVDREIFKITKGE